MDSVFSTDDLPPHARYGAWRDAICDVYVNVEVCANDPENYRGYIREARFGDVTLTDILLSEQRIRRDRRHIARLDKDCCYVQLLHSGTLDVLQRGETLRSNPACGAIFSAAEQYELQVRGEVRSFYLELPRDAFAQRFPQQRIPVSAAINTTRGIGRVVTEFCATLASESSRVTGEQRRSLGGQVMDLLALALMAPPEDSGIADASVRTARLRAVQRWIEANLAEPDLSLQRIAAANGISVRYLHVLFEGTGMSVSEWIQYRRLQLAHDRLARGQARSITELAFDLGFSSSAHFSTLFRRRFGVAPRDVWRPPARPDSQTGGDGHLPPRTAA
jgi:AraC-like DNA-binding protein